MIKTIIFISVILLFSTKSSNAQIYTWKDKQGITHATDNLQDAPAEIQEKYAIPIEIIELPKPIEQPKPKTASRIIMSGEGRYKNGQFFCFTNSLETVKSKPYKYKFKWTCEGGMIFYTNRIFDDNEEMLKNEFPEGCLPHGKFTQIIYK